MSTHWIGSPKKCYWSGLNEAPSGTREDDRGALRDINGYSPFTLPTLMVVEVWLQVPEKLGRIAGRGYDGRVVRAELTRCGARVRAYRWHKYWKGHGRSINTEPTQPTCHDKMTWPPGRTLQTTDPGRMMRLYGLCNTEMFGALACRGGYRSRWHRRLWPRRGKLRLLAYFRRSSWLFFQRGEPAKKTC